MAQLRVKASQDSQGRAFVNLPTKTMVEGTEVMRPRTPADPKIEGDPQVMVTVVVEVPDEYVKNGRLNPGQIRKMYRGQKWDNDDVTKDVDV